MATEMEGFIPQVARRLYKEYGDDISSLEILFPSRRARLFFADTLSQITSKPLWQPTYSTVDEVMEQLSGLTKGDQTRVMTELYKVYSQHHEESFDAFYFWGEMLLADFDAIDKYLINAEMLFSNISDLKNIDNSFDYLTPEQVEIIARFWSSFGAEAEFSDEKQKFISIWKTLKAVYHDFKAALLSKSMAYTGMMYRDAAEKIRDGRVEIAERKRYAIVGFNALSECEKRLFDHLAKRHDVDFFWDYDHYYLDDKEQEAGLFLRENIKRFPQKLTLPHSNNSFSEPKTIKVISSPSDSLQCKYVAEYLNEVASREGELGKDCAIVLTDESLLMPVLYSIPSDVEKINVTMGYPLRLTLEYSFVERLIELQAHKRLKNSVLTFYHADASGLLSHPFVVEQNSEQASKLSAGIIERQQIYIGAKELCGDEGLIRSIFDPKIETWGEVADYLIDIVSEVASGSLYSEENKVDFRQRMEFAGIIVDNIRKLRNSLEECEIELSVKIFASLLRKILQNIRIPYTGEPLEGVQVMGILETRNLDFKNVVILSMNDDKFPGNRTVSSSFIPYNLKIAYGLPTQIDHEGVYAYYFYRLLQRAENIDLVYSSRSDEKSSGEQSRYIYQLDYESPHKIERKNIGLNVSLTSSAPIEVEKSGGVEKSLRKFTNTQPVKLSPTAFFNYVACPLKFYFYSIEKIRIDDEIVEEVDAAMFGTILHYAMEVLYRPLVGKANIKGLMKGLDVAAAVDEAITEKYFYGDEVKVEEYSGNVLLVRDIVCRYINTCIIPYDAKQSDFEIEELEKKVECEFEFEIDGAKQKILFGGVADRVDILNSGQMRVVDYKTGAERLDFKSVETLFIGSVAEKNAAALQTLLYAMMLSRSDGRDVQPALYYVRQLNKEGYSHQILEKSTGCFVTSYADYRDEFEAQLRGVLAEIFNPKTPFTQCDDAKQCLWCDFNVICRR